MTIQDRIDKIKRLIEDTKNEINLFTNKTYKYISETKADKAELEVLKYMIDTRKAVLKIHEANVKKLESSL